ncbi:hypothetical protein BC831DRAFT_437029 [Entophlyctis helioformis]|nr:hypothetical protein BC831DRAFT_437029 [Entophlyctis helioformis]
MQLISAFVAAVALVASVDAHSPKKCTVYRKDPKVTTVSTGANTTVTIIKEVVKVVEVVLPVPNPIPTFNKTYEYNSNLTASAASIPFLPKRGPIPAYGSYIQQTVDFASVVPVFNALNATYGPLKTRGEAHITVVSPPEVLFALSNVMTIEEIEAVVNPADHPIQSVKFTPVCVGRQSMVESKATSPFVGKRTYVYNLLVDAPELFEARRRLQAAYIKKGGDPSNFDAIAGFYPHITLGFVDHDWFPEDHVYKTYYTCFANVKASANPTN